MAVTCRAEEEEEGVCRGSLCRPMLPSCRIEDGPVDRLAAALAAEAAASRSFFALSCSDSRCFLAFSFTAAFLFLSSIASAFRFSSSAAWRASSACRLKEERRTRGHLQTLQDGVNPTAGTLGRVVRKWVFALKPTG